MLIAPFLPPTIGGRLSGGTPGSLLYAGSGGVLAQATVTGLVKGTGSGYTAATAPADYLSQSCSPTLSGAWTFNSTVNFPGLAFAEEALNGDGNHPALTCGDVSPTIGLILLRKNAASTFYFGADSDTGGNVFRGKAGFTASGNGASAAIQLFASNQGGFATANTAEVLLGPHSGYISNNSPRIIAYNNPADGSSGVNAGIRIKYYSGSLLTAWQIDPDGFITVMGNRLAFFNGTPVVRQTNVPDTSGDTLAQLETSVNALKAVIRAYNLMG